MNEVGPLEHGDGVEDDRFGKAIGCSYDENCEEIFATHESLDRHISWHVQKSVEQGRVLNEEIMGMTGSASPNTIYLSSRPIE